MSNTTVKAGWKAKVNQFYSVIPPESSSRIIAFYYLLS